MRIYYSLQFHFEIVIILSIIDGYEMRGLKNDAG